MDKTIKAEPKKVDVGVSFRLWVGMLLPPIAWAVQLQALWLTSEFGCRQSNFTWNHVVCGLALIVALLAGAIAWWEWNASGATTDEDGGDRMSRRRFMALIGILTSALFSVTIIAQWLPTMMGVPCDK